MFNFFRSFVLMAIAITFSFALASTPANAAEQPQTSLPVPVVEGAVFGDNFNNDTQTIIDAGLFRKRWKGGAAYDMDDDTWRATVTDRRSGETYVLGGSHSSEEEAQSEGDRVADNLNNNVMDGPGCNPPLVLC